MQDPLPTLWPQSFKDEAQMKRELEFYKKENRSLKALVEGMELSRCGLTLAKVERGYILDTLVCCHGNRTYPPDFSASRFAACAASCTIMIQMPFTLIHDFLQIITGT